MKFMTILTRHCPAEYAFAFSGFFSPYLFLCTCQEQYLCQIRGKMGQVAEKHLTQQVGNKNRTREVWGSDFLLETELDHIRPR